MAQQLIGVGSALGDGNGDIRRDAWIKVNENTTELYSKAAAASAAYASAIWLDETSTTLASKQVYIFDTTSAVDTTDVESVTYTHITHTLPSPVDGAEIHYRTYGPYYTKLLGKVSGEADGVIVGREVSGVLTGSTALDTWVLSGEASEFNQIAFTVNLVST